MKKFFKALALVLALALVIGVVPAQATSAKVKAVKKLYVGGAQGKSADGKLTSSIKNKVAIYKLAGYTKATKEGHKFTAEVQKDNGIVKITKNYVVAQKLGKALVDIYVDGEKVGTTTINSKINATEDTLQLLCNGEKLPEEFVVAGKYTFTLPRVGKDSDERRLYINGELVADDKDAPRTYTHVFTKSEEGKVTFKFEAYQDAKLDGALVSKTYEAKVVPPKAESLKQTAWDSFEITFAGDIEAGGYYADLKAWETTGTDGIANDVYYKVNDVRVPFSSVKTSTPKENVLKVTMYGAFVPDTTYYVDIAGKTFEFKAAGNQAKDVVAIEFTKDTAVVETDAKLGYKLLNSLGIDITGTAETAQNGNLEFTTDSNVASLDNAGRTIYFGNVGDKATVKAVYSFYDPDDNYNEKKTENSVVITAVAGASTEFVSAKYSIGKAISYEEHRVKMNDAAATVLVEAKFKTGSTTTTYGIGGEPFGFPLHVKVADEHYAMITNDGTDNADSDSISGVNQGGTSLILYYVNTNNNKEVVVAVLPITVTEARKATTISASITESYTGSTCVNTSGAAADLMNILVEVKDQYGDTFQGNNANVEFKLRTGSPAGSGFDETFTIARIDKKVELYSQPVVDARWFNGTESTTEKAIAYTVKADGLTTVVSLRTKSVTAHSGATLSVSSSANSMKTTLAKWGWNSACNDVTFTVNEMSGSYWTGLRNFALTSQDITTSRDISDYTNLGLAAASTGSAIVATVKFNGSVLNAPTATTVSPANGYYVDKYNTVLLDDMIKVVTNNTVKIETYNDKNQTYVGNVKIPAGTYVVTFYQINDLTNGDDGKCTWKSLGSRSLSVSDEGQEIPTFVQDSQTVDQVADALAAVRDAYTFKWNGVKLDDSAIVDVNTKASSDGKLYVYYAVVEVSSTLVEYGSTGTSYRFVVPVGELLN